MCFNEEMGEGEKKEENRRGTGEEEGAAGEKGATGQMEKAEELDQKGRQKWGQEKWEGDGGREGERQGEERPTSRKEWTATRSQAPQGQWPLAWFGWLGDNCSSPGEKTHLPHTRQFRHQYHAAVSARGGVHQVSEGMRMSGP